jgi:hypothetical protein
MKNSIHPPELPGLVVDLKAYFRGFVDEVLGRRYNDGVTPEHTLIVCVPPTEQELKESPTAAYRAGRLAAMATRN